MHGLVIQHNAIFNNQIGIWLSTGVDTTSITGNVFANVRDARVPVAISRAAESWSCANAGTTTPFQARVDVV